ncbi:amidohydrolase family protein [bacterium]|nr:amidohydrolase family protein [bacterium]
MKNIILLFAASFIIMAQSVSAAPAAAPGATVVPVDTGLILIGKIPGRYFKDVDAHSYVMGYIDIKNRVIQKLAQVKEADIAAFEKANVGRKILKLKREGQASYDVIYPGLINLHNHTKQNNIPVWGDAKGQFANRFEWRDWPNYKYSVSGNMNPWVDYARAVECATFRWSELSALVLGTTYLQGPSSCVENFGIQRVEDAGAFVSAKAAVQAPTDLVMPMEMEFVWNTLGPIIRTGKTYEFALAETIKKHCPTIAVTEQNVNSAEMLKILKDQAKLTELCAKENLPPKFIRYVYWIHPTISGRKNYYANKKVPPSAVIAHLAEGRRDDDYNKKEYEVVKMLGLDLPKMNFVHGVGIPSTDFPELAKKDIGLIWSPFSNLILYSQTLDIANALKSGVTVAIGSDWVPTGTKSVLEEVKIARKYILRDMDKEGLMDVFTGKTGKVEKMDEELFKMMTENPAKMINHFEIKKAAAVTKANPSGYTESAVGTIAEGAMGSVIIASMQDANPYTNLVEKTDEKNINLVVVDGKAVYGNKSYLDALGYNDQTYEVLPVDSAEHSSLQVNTEIKAPEDKTPEIKLQFLAQLIKSFTQKFDPVVKCEGFSDAKALVTTNSVAADADLTNFSNVTGINLDKVKDITKLIAINLMTQNRNKIDPVEGKPAFALKYFPSLYSCNDENHVNRTQNFIKLDGSKDELQTNREIRESLITKYKLGRAPKQLAEKYK